MGIELVRERVRRASALLAGLDVSELDAAEVRTVIADLRTERSHSARLEVALTARAAELHDAGGGEDPVDLLTGAGSMPRRRAVQLVGHAELLTRMPALAVALKDGRVGEAHIDAVAVARRRIDPTLRSTFDAQDSEIANYAVSHDPDRLAEHLQIMVRRLERDHTRDLELRRRRAVRVSKWTDKMGMYQLHGVFDPEMGARIFTAIDAAVDTLRQHPQSLVPGDDPHDPLGSEPEFVAAHALARLVTHGHADQQPGIAEVVVLVDEQTLVSGDHQASVAEFHDGTPADSDMVRRLCCEAIVTAVIVSADGKMPLVAGRSQRTATRAQRRALRAVHRTCAIEGCGVRFDWCQIHHVIFWDDHDGPTDLDNLVPLCTRHHHLVHDAGWRLHLDPADRTLTVYRPDGTMYREMRPPGLRPPVDERDSTQTRTTGPPHTSTTAA